MIILMDTNEKATNPKLVRRMQRAFPKMKIRQLEFGDIQVILDDGSILAIERKDASDLLGSIGDGRIFRQVQAMNENAKWTAVLLEGTLEFDKNDMTIANGRLTGWKGKSVRSAMMYVAWSGCPIFQTDEAGFPNSVQELIEFCSKPDVHFQSLGRKRIVTFPPISLAEEIVAAFPGIGLKKSKALMNYASDMNNGTPLLAQALCWISRFPKIHYQSRPEGWGDKIVANVRLALGLGDGEYLTIEEEKEGKDVKSKSSKKK